MNLKDVIGGEAPKKKGPAELLEEEFVEGERKFRAEFKPRRRLLILLTFPYQLNTTYSL